MELRKSPPCFEWSKRIEATKCKVILDIGGKQNYCKQSLVMEADGNAQSNPQWHTTRMVNFENDGGKVAIGTSFLVSAPSTSRPHEVRETVEVGASQTDKISLRDGKNRHTREISVDDFPVNVATGREVLKKDENCEVNQVDEGDCGGVGKINRRRKLCRFILR